MVEKQWDLKVKNNDIDVLYFVVGKITKNTCKLKFRKFTSYTSFSTLTKCHDNKKKT